MELKTQAERALYHETCRYVERLQETFNQILSVEEWESTVQEVFLAMKFLTRRSDSANGDERGKV